MHRVLVGCVRRIGHKEVLHTNVGVDGEGWHETTDILAFSKDMLKRSAQAACSYIRATNVAVEKQLNEKVFDEAHNAEEFFETAVGERVDYVFLLNEDGVWEFLDVLVFLQSAACRSGIQPHNATTFLIYAIDAMETDRATYAAAAEISDLAVETIETLGTRIRAQSHDLEVLKAKRRGMLLAKHDELAKSMELDELRAAVEVYNAVLAAKQ